MQLPTDRVLRSNTAAAAARRASVISSGSSSCASDASEVDTLDGTLDSERRPPTSHLLRGFMLNYHRAGTPHAHSATREHATGIPSSLRTICASDYDGQHFDIVLSSRGASQPIRVETRVIANDWTERSSYISWRLYEKITGRPKIRPHVESPTVQRYAEPGSTTSRLRLNGKSLENLGRVEFEIALVDIFQPTTLVRMRVAACVVPGLMPDLFVGEATKTDANLAD